MRINTNTAAMNTYSNLTSANASKSNSLAKLSSGLRINKAGDDAAGLAISEKMKNQVSGMTQASRNAQDGISLIQTAEGALGETHSILNRMRDLTVQAANGTNTESDKNAIQAELTSLTEEVDRIAGDTKFNTQGLMNAKEGITSSSITESKVSSTQLDLAYSDVMGASVPTGSVGGAIEDTANAFSKLSKEDLEKVVANYNVKIAEVTKNLPANAITAAVTLTDVTDYDKTAPEAVKVTEAGFTGKPGKIASFTDAYNKVNKTNLSFDDIKVKTMTSVELTDIETQFNKNEKTRFDNETVAANKAIADSQIASSDIKETSSKKFTFQIGANAHEQISVNIKNMSAEGLGVKDINVSAVDANTDLVLETLDKAISDVSEQRANLGAVQNRLDHTVSNLATTKENLSEANSRITDVDMAEEMMSFTKSNILSQASTSMLAQANQMPQSVLSLLQ